MKYDYLIVGAGLFGAVFSYLAHKDGKRCIIIEKRNHIAGNIYTENIDGIQVHQYGAHIFHTSDQGIWDFVNKFARFNNFINSPIAKYKNKIYNLPFNMNTFYQIWGVTTPSEAIAKIDEQRLKANITNPKNLEEQAISLVGEDIYKILIKGYTEKQWGRDCKDLPPSIIRRIPVRFSFDNNYFNDKYQGVPELGYTKMVENMLDGIEVHLNTDFLAYRDDLKKIAKRIVYTGPIDAFFDYIFGPLQYRSVRFETLTYPIENFQGVAVVNYNEREVPYTRIIEHKHFLYGKQPNTVISLEYPSEWNINIEPYYPINDIKNSNLYQKYATLAKKYQEAYFGGRLGQYKYYDMDKVIMAAIKCYTEFK